ncbi:AAA family ATPase [Spirosoma sp. KCTC 42546]|uniref:AAA family ATPase n=1 Tax=Spirosoma sp. KCTC 42546 TaxID=2520506 RepID=UPI001159A60F|nr:AAA family ATPase [Spirosoma sp. KCTC 42546]QDK80967.1 AAA family ATPase [Spirosoma sp. KCTC 42546]
MNEAMTPEELLKAENAFIRLHNQGVILKEIAEQLGVEIGVIKKWKENLEVAIQQSNNPEGINVTVQNKDASGAYLYKHSLNLTFSGIEKLKFDLVRLAIRDTNDDKFGHISRKAGEYIDFVENHLKSFHYKIDDNNGEATFEYHLIEDSNDSETIQKAQDLFSFYYEHSVRFEKLAEKSILIDRETKDVFLNYQNALPYSLKSLIIRDFEGISSCQIQNIPIDTPWLFISGNNGYGKTTFLRAVSIGLLGSKEDDQIIANDIESKIAVEYKSIGQNIINNLWALGFQPLEYLACYGPSRLQIQSKMSQNEVAEKSTTTYGLFNPDGILLNIESKLIEWHLEKNERLEQVKGLFKEVIPHLADIIVQKNKQDDYEVLYVERAEQDETTTFDPVPFNQLAAGFRSIIGLIGDLLIRFIRKQPHVKQLGDLAGIVLIDELENHLHPKWQYQLPTLLSKVFPNIQFIAATHSVIPILGAPKNSVFLKLDRSKAKGITVERIDIDIANLLPNSILTSPIFDMDTIRPITNEDVGKLRTEDTYDEVVANDAIDKQLRELDNDPSQYPALLQE